MPYLQSSQRYCLHLFVLLMTSSGMVYAQNSFDLEQLNPGEIMVNLNSNEQAQVEQDTLHAQLYYSTQGRDRATLQDEVNRVMTEALEQLADGEVEYSIELYRVFPVLSSRPTRGDNENPVWRAQQSVSLTSQDSAAVLDLVADMQGLGLAMGRLYYSLSPQREEEVADSLMEAALNKLRNRAEAAAAAMGKSDVEIVEITMNSSNNVFFGARGAAISLSAEAMDVSTPVAEPGTTTVIFNVSARVILIP